MIKNTISRIKRVCAVAFIPRVLRGDLRYIPVSYGIQRSAQKSTRSSKSSLSRRKRRGKRSEDPQRYAVSTVCENSLKPQSSKFACHCDKCNKDQNIITYNVAEKRTSSLPNLTPDHRRVIEAIFSEPDNISFQSGPNIPCNLLSNTATHFNITDDSHDGKLIKDNRINPGTYGIIDNAKLGGSKKLNDKSEEIDYLDKDARTSPNNDVVLMNDINNLDKVMNIVPCKDAQEKQNNDTSIAKNDNTSSSDDTADKKISMKSDPSMTIDTETLNTYKILKSKNINCKDNEANQANIKLERKTVNSQPESSIFSLKTNKQDKVQLTQNTEIKHKADSITAATTLKEDEEKLTQKLEHMEETPTVEAEKTKIDGFNVIPKVLGNMQKNVNCADEIAKRCLGLSSKRQVDEILMREMEKLGIPLTGQKETVSQKNNDSKAVYECGETKKGFPNQESELSNKQTVKELQEQYIYDLNRTQMTDKFVNVDETIPAAFSQNRKPSATPSLVKTYEMSENPYNSNENTWDKNQLDPKHVLTCNETCPISPKPITENSYSLEDTQAIYDRDVTSKQNIQESIKHNPILEHEHPCGSGDNFIENSIKAASSAMTPATEKEILKEDIVSSNPANIYDSAGKYSLPGHMNSPELYQMNMRDVHLEYSGFNTMNSRGFNDVEPEESPSEKLQVADENKELLATSEELKETSQNLQAATEILQTTSKTIQQVSRETADTSKNLNNETMRNAGEKFDTIVINLESTTEKLQDLCENVEQLILTKARPREIKPKTDNVLSEVTTVTEGPASKILPNQVLNNFNSKLNSGRREDDETVSSSKCTDSAQQETDKNVLFTGTDNFTFTLEPLPELKDDTKLSELMKAVQHRNKLIECSNYLAIVQKKKSVPPLSMPMQNTPVRVIPNYPSLRPKPRVCIPKPPRPKMKFSRCDLSTFDNQPNLLDTVYSEDLAVTNEVPSLHDEVMSKLLKLGCILRSTYKEKKERTLEAILWARSHHRNRRSRLFRTKNYDPWIPIPSWPKYEKHVKQKLQCPKDGCKSFPPTRAEHDPRCKQHSCDTFPVFPSRKFSKLDYHAVLLTKDHAKERIIDLVENEYSPILSRTFNKTEWTKPKYTDKPYTDSRQREENVKTEALDVKQIKPPKIIDRKKNSNNFVPKCEPPDLTILPNNVNAQIPILNLERLLIPTLASVSYSIVRHFSDKTKGADEIFWRPKSKIPTEDEIRNMKDDPRVSVSLGNDAKYLLLTFKSGGEKPVASKMHKKGVVDIQKSSSGVKRESSLTNCETKSANTKRTKETVQKAQN